MEETRELMKKIERVFVERMSLAELLYHALLECRENCALAAGG